ncbi:MAG: hypothetical protein C5S49_00080 [Candidatus Methanogaster sp.]|nr:MAG: hypothetical protein C5S49_00080 [ANME-2 cluster archaeon]
MPERKLIIEVEINDDAGGSIEDPQTGDSFPGPLRAGGKEVSRQFAGLYGTTGENEKGKQKSAHQNIPF